jgi:hypothetical protein
MRAHAAVAKAVHHPVKACSPAARASDVVLIES